MVGSLLGEEDALEDVYVAITSKAETTVWYIIFLAITTI